MIRPIGCVVFDIDDTLYLERDYVHSGMEAVGEWLVRTRGLAGFADVAFKEFLLGVRGVTFERALVVMGVHPDSNLIRHMVQEYRHHTPLIHLLPDAEEAFAALSGRVRIAVVSDGPLASQRAKAAALGLAGLCDPIVLTEELGPGFGKPHPRAFELVQEKTGTLCSGCVYVADNPKKDFEGPKALGWITIRVRRPGGLHCAEDSGPDVDREIPDLMRLTAVLKEIS